MEYVILGIVVTAITFWLSKDRFTISEQYSIWKVEYDNIFDTGRKYKDIDRLVSRYYKIYSKMKSFNGNSLDCPEDKKIKINEHNELIDLLTSESRKANSVYKWRYRWTKKRRLQFFNLYEDTYDKTIRFSSASGTVKSIKRFNQLMNKLVKSNHEKIEDVVHKIREILDVITQPPTEYLSESKASKLRNPHLLSLLQKNKDIYADYLELNEIDLFISFQIEFHNVIEMFNKAFVENEMKTHKAFFNDINDRSLDQMQRVAVITDEENNLIISGAGSGKTLTLVGKIKYLIEIRGINPSEILAISFTNKAVNELSDRLKKSTGQDIEVVTFHKLGRELLIESLGKKIDIDDQDLFIGIKKIIEKLSDDDKAFAVNLSEYIGLYYFPNVTSLDFEKENDLYADLRSKGAMPIQDFIKNNSNKKDLKTYSGERVKSFEELLIANYLFLHDISYEYEKPYEFDTSSLSHRQYKPDFYLSDYNLYLEHFGVDQNMKANHLKNELERRNYVEGMEWKRNIHLTNKTNLIETYSYYHKEGILFEKLDQILRDHGVIVHDFNNDRMIQIAAELKNSNQVNNLAKTVTTFVQLFKSNDYDLNFFVHLNNEIMKCKSNMYTYKRELLLIGIIETVYEAYRNQLSSRKQYDFNDLINHAIKVVLNDSVKVNYKYIIIDEYQDISMSRYKLIKALKDKTNCKIVAVGDDWQSIYRFAGSEVNLFHNFETLFGKTEVIKIPNTYRSSQNLADISRAFILKNTRQIDKIVISSKRLNNPIKLMIHSYHSQAEILMNILDRHIDNSSRILLLGRTNSCINPIISSGFFELLNDGSVVYVNNPFMKIEFLTVHKSKGLEADVVIILNLNNKINGFPNKIENDPILRFVISDFDKYPFEEERRLFYVALTRSKNEVYLLCEKENESVFVSEMIKDLVVDTIDSTSTQDEVEYLDRKCPLCGSESLMKRKSQFGEFVSCKNFPYCDYKISNIQVAIDNIKCNVCGDYMVLRDSIYGKFYGCSNFPYCSNKATYKERTSEVIKASKLESFFESENFFEPEDNFEPENILKPEITLKQEPITKKDSKQRNIDTSISVNKAAEVKTKGIVKTDNPGENENIKIKTDKKIEIELNQMKIKERSLIEKNSYRFKKGSEVTHASFGNGMVIQNDGVKIEVLFDDKTTLNFAYESVIIDRILRAKSSTPIRESEHDQLIAESEKMHKNNDFSQKAIEVNQILIANFDEISKDTIKYHLRLAKAYKNLGQFEEAVAIYNDVLKVDPKNNEALDNLSYLVKLLKTVHENYMDEWF